MSVTLTWITPEAEKLVATIARVSNPQNQHNEETAPRLLRYLIRNKHWSPFEMANLCVEIQTTREISAQILRHRSFTFQEYSQRYAKTPLPAVPKLRRQDTKNRQSSHDDLPVEVTSSHQLEIGNLFSKIYEEYESLLNDGVAKETARSILPMCSPTTIYMNGTLRSWLHYCDLRCEKGTQLEHRIIADQVKKILYESVPIIAEAMWAAD